DLGGKLVGVEGKILQLNATGRGQDNVRYSPMLIQKLNYLASEVGQSDFPPTTQAQAVAQELHQQAQQYQQQFAQVIEEVQRFNAMLREHDIPNIFLPKAGRPLPRPAAEINKTKPTANHEGHEGQAAGKNE